VVSEKAMDVYILGINRGCCFIDPPSQKKIKINEKNSRSLAATLYQGNPDSNHKLWNIGSTERYLLHMQAPLQC
jgi:hypothetical protein